MIETISKNECWSVKEDPIEKRILTLINDYVTVINKNENSTKKIFLYAIPTKELKKSHQKFNFYKISSSIEVFFLPVKDNKKNVVLNVLITGNSYQATEVPVKLPTYWETIIRLFLNEKINK